MDGPLAAQVARIGGLESFIRPPGLAKAEYIGLDACTLAIVDVAAVLKQVSRFVEEADGRRIQGPIRLEPGDQPVHASDELPKDTVGDGLSFTREEQV